MSESSQHPTFSVRIPDRSRRLARIKANAIGIPLGEYIHRLIVADTVDIAHVVPANSANSAENGED